MDKHIFVSYKHEDGDFADILISKIKEAGFETWVDNDQLHAGEDWRAEIDNAIKNSTALVVIMTPAAKASEYVTYEWAFAWGAGVRVIPIMYKETVLHPRLEALHYLNFTTRTPRPWDGLMKVLKNAANNLDPPVTLTSQKSPPASLHTSSQRSKEQWLNMANIFLEQQDYEEALEACEEAIRLDPDAAAYSTKGNVLNTFKRYEEALAAYRQAIRLDFNSAPIYTGKGTALTKLKRYSEALAAFKQAIRLDAHYAPAYNGRGDTLYEVDRYDEALADYEQAIHLDPNNAEYHTNKSKALYSLKRYEEALTACKQAIHLDPDYAIAYYNKGNALYDLKRSEEALAALEQAIHLDPDYAIAYYTKAVVLNSLGKVREAQQAFNRANQLGYSG